MKSREIKLSNDMTSVIEALQEIEYSSAKARLTREQTNILRLFTEEMMSMTMDILKDCKGTFWMECTGMQCQLHITASAPIEDEAKKAFIEASKKKVNSPVKGLKNKISALLAGMLGSLDSPELYSSMSAGFTGGYMGPARMTAAVWSLAAYEKAAGETETESDGLERSILTGMADDVTVSVKNYWVELVVKKTFDSEIKAAMPKFTGLSHICIFVEDIDTAAAYYKRLLGASVDHYLPNWKNPGFFKAAGFIQEAQEGQVSIAFLNVPGTKLTIELMRYHYPTGRTEPVIFAANDVSGARHVALKVTNIEEAFLHVKSMPDTRLINESDEYKVFKISDTKPTEVRFVDQDLREIDQRNIDAAAVLSQVKYFYFIDRYGLQWEFEQGHTDIGD